MSELDCQVSSSPIGRLGGAWDAKAEIVARPAIPVARRIVVKLGTRVLIDSDGRPARERIGEVAATIAGLCANGREVVLVSSGAVGVGSRALDLPRLPTATEPLQASAAVGQAQLTTLYQQHFSRLGFVCGQLLISQRDFDDRPLSIHLRRTLETLLRHHAVPILNENDALRRRFMVPSINGPYRIFEDNDRLAALVAGTLRADLLVLLTDVPGLFDRDPRVHPGARLLPALNDVAQLSHLDTTSSNSGPGRGGMKSKIEASLIAGRSGCPTVIADGRQPGVLSHLMAGEQIGTWVPAVEGRLAVKRHWIAYASAPRGTLHLDDGAVEAIVRRSGSLLAAGVVTVQGTFRSGDVVELRGPGGALVGHARSRLSDRETRLLCRPPLDSGRCRPLIRRGDIVFQASDTEGI